ncbi:hypothetical protein [Streptomyces yanii]|uniref:Uncharacterized protein n=1 Tax=Streptomyces yanii TaxID=78510 RepID=A0ABV5RMJ8_9ACTN
METSIDPSDTHLGNWLGSRQSNVSTIGAVSDDWRLRVDMGHREPPYVRSGSVRAEETPHDILNRLPENLLQVSDPEVTDWAYFSGLVATDR